MEQLSTISGSILTYVALPLLGLLVLAWLVLTIRNRSRVQKR